MSDNDTAAGASGGTGGGVDFRLNVGIDGSALLKDAEKVGTEAAKLIASRISEAIKKAMKDGGESGAADLTRAIDTAAKQSSLAARRSSRARRAVERLSEKIDSITPGLREAQSSPIPPPPDSLPAAPVPYDYRAVHQAQTVSAGGAGSRVQQYLQRPATVASLKAMEASSIQFRSGSQYPAVMKAGEPIVNPATGRRVGGDYHIPTGIVRYDPKAPGSTAGTRAWDLSHEIGHWVGQEVATGTGARQQQFSRYFQKAVDFARARARGNDTLVQEALASAFADATSGQKKGTTGDPTFQKKEWYKNQFRALFETGMRKAATAGKDELWAQDFLKRAGGKLAPEQTIRRITDYSRRARELEQGRMFAPERSSLWSAVGRDISEGKEVDVEKLLSFFSVKRAFSANAVQHPQSFPVIFNSGEKGSSLGRYSRMYNYGWYQSRTGDTPLEMEKKQYIAAHEIGHWLTAATDNSRKKAESWRAVEKGADFPDKKGTFVKMNPMRERIASAFADELLDLPEYRSGDSRIEGQTEKEKSRYYNDVRPAMRELLFDIYRNKKHPLHSYVENLARTASDPEQFLRYVGEESGKSFAPIEKMLSSSTLYAPSRVKSSGKKRLPKTGIDELDEVLGRGTRKKDKGSTLSRMLDMLGFSESDTEGRKLAMEAFRAKGGPPHARELSPFLNYLAESELNQEKITRELASRLMKSGTGKSAQDKLNHLISRLENAQTPEEIGKLTESLKRRLEYYQRMPGGTVGSYRQVLNKALEKGRKPGTGLLTMEKLSDDPDLREGTTGFFSRITDQLLQVGAKGQSRAEKAIKAAEQRAERIKSGVSPKVYSEARALGARIADNTLSLNEASVRGLVAGWTELTEAERKSTFAGLFSRLLPSGVESGVSADEGAVLALAKKSGKSADVIRGIVRASAKEKIGEAERKASLALMEKESGLPGIGRNVGLEWWRQRHAGVTGLSFARAAIEKHTRDAQEAAGRITMPGATRQQIEKGMEDLRNAQERMRASANTTFGEFASSLDRAAKVPGADVKGLQDLKARTQAEMQNQMEGFSKMVGWSGVISRGQNRIDRISPYAKSASEKEMDRIFQLAWRQQAGLRKQYGKQISGGMLYSASDTLESMRSRTLEAFEKMAGTSMPLSGESADRIRAYGSGLVEERTVGMEHRLYSSEISRMNKAASRDRKEREQAIRTAITEGEAVRKLELDAIRSSQREKSKNVLAGIRKSESTRKLEVEAIRRSEAERLRNASSSVSQAESNERLLNQAVRSSEAERRRNIAASIRQNRSTQSLWNSVYRSGDMDEKKRERETEARIQETIRQDESDRKLWDAVWKQDARDRKKAGAAVSRKTKAREALLSTGLQSQILGGGASILKKELARDADSLFQLSSFFTDVRRQGTAAPDREAGRGEVDAVYDAALAQLDSTFSRARKRVAQKVRKLYQTHKGDPEVQAAIRELARTEFATIRNQYNSMQAGLLSGRDSAVSAVDRQFQVKPQTAPRSFMRGLMGGMIRGATWSPVATAVMDAVDQQRMASAGGKGPGGPSGTGLLGFVAGSAIPSALGAFAGFALFSTIASGLRMITSGLRSVAMQAVQTGSSVEQLTLRMNSLSGGEGKALFGVMSKTGHELAISIDQLTESYAKMRAMGLNPTIEQMKSLVGYVRAIGQTHNLDYIVLAISQVASKGKVEMQEMRQLAERGVPALAILQEKLGLQGTKIGDIGKMYIPAGRAIPALFQGMAERSQGMNDVFLGTFEGQMEKLRLAWFDFKKEFADSGMLSFAKSLVSTIREFVDTLNRAEIPKLLGTGINAARSAAGNVATSASWLWDRFGRFTPWGLRMQSYSASVRVLADWADPRTKEAANLYDSSGMGQGTRSYNKDLEKFGDQQVWGTLKKRRMEREEEQRQVELSLSQMERSLDLLQANLTGTYTSSLTGMSYDFRNPLRREEMVRRLLSGNGAMDDPKIMGDLMGVVFPSMGTSPISGMDIGQLSSVQEKVIRDRQNLMVTRGTFKRPGDMAKADRIIAQMTSSLGEIGTEIKTRLEETLSDTVLAGASRNERRLAEVKQQRELNTFFSQGAGRMMTEEQRGLYEEGTWKKFNREWKDRSDAALAELTSTSMSGSFDQTAIAFQALPHTLKKMDIAFQTLADESEEMKRALAGARRATVSGVVRAMTIKEGELQDSIFRATSLHPFAEKGIRGGFGNRDSDIALHDLAVSMTKWLNSPDLSLEGVMSLEEWTKRSDMREALMGEGVNNEVRRILSTSMAEDLSPKALTVSGGAAWNTIAQSSNWQGRLVDGIMEGNKVREEIRRLAEEQARREAELKEQVQTQPVLEMAP